MSTFAVTNSDQILDSVNYLLSNLGQGGNATGNVTIPTGTLVGNLTTGVVTPFNTGGNAYSYLYQYVNLRYANNATGSSGFSSLPANSQYFGVFNSVTSTASLNPTDYSWSEVAGGFGTTKTIYYSAVGGRQVLFAAASSPPSSNYVISVANVAIDLDVVTTAAGTPGERGPIPMGYVITTADPGAASSATLTGWFQSSRTALTPPIGTGLIPVAGDTAYFTFPTTGASETYTFNGSAWNSAVGQVVSGATLVANTTPGNAIITSTITGNLIVPATITGNLVAASTITGNLIAANTITGNTIQVSTITGNLIAANTITGNTIQVGTITGNRVAASTITGNLIAASTITGNLIAANTITGNTIQTSTITANQIAANTITSTQIATGTIIASDIAAGTITSTQIAAGTITATNIATNTITAGQIAAGTITSTQIASDTITATNILSGTITATQIAANTITSTQIATGTIVASDIAAGTITSSQIAANTISATNILTGTITSGQIAAGTITATNIQSGTITGTQIAAGTVTATNIATNTITANQIAAGTITATQISTDYLYTGNIISNNATFGSNTSSGYWLRHSDGDARFGGNVSIGANLNVSGLITTGSLIANTVATTTIVPAAVSLGQGINSTTVATVAPATANTVYLDTSKVTTTTVEANQPVYFYGFLNPQWTYTVTGTITDLYYLTSLYRQNPDLSYTLVGVYNQNEGTSISTGSYTRPLVFPYVGYLNLPPSVGVNGYVFGVSWYKTGAGSVTMNSIQILERNLVAQGLKR
jgi:hypothetical protein